MLSSKPETTMRMFLSVCGLRSEWSLEIYTNQPKQFQSRDSRAREFFPPLAIRSPCPRRLVGRPRKSSEKHTRQPSPSRGLFRGNFDEMREKRCAADALFVAWELVFDLLSGATYLSV